MKFAAKSHGSPLEQLEKLGGKSFPNLSRARARTSECLIERKRQLAELPHDAGVSIVLMGSWGRSEVTNGSDDDYMVLVKGANRTGIHPPKAQIRSILDKPPGDQGVFGEPAFSDEMIGNIGLEEDSNSNLTRRMLFLLESSWATGADVYGRVRGELFDRYLDDSIRDYHVPRFLLNDTIRYWRTVCVDFAGKERKGPKKWGIRNAKLRTSRKLLFASGLLPVLECDNYECGEMRRFLERRLQMPPADRLIAAFIEHDCIDAGLRAVQAYDEFVGLLDDGTRRTELEKVEREDSASSVVFKEAKRLGHDLEQGLLALLFERERFQRLVREYAIF